MQDIEQIALFDGFDTRETIPYNQFKLTNEIEIVKYLKQFIILEETDSTPYKHRLAYYNKKAHYINNKKVNVHVYTTIKNWLERFD